MHGRLNYNVFCVEVKYSRIQSQYVFCLYVYPKYTVFYRVFNLKSIILELAFLFFKLE